jgi:hypothetical protein
MAACISTGCANRWPIDNGQNGMLQCGRISLLCGTRKIGDKSGTSQKVHFLASRLTRISRASRERCFTEVHDMDMMGRVGLVEIPVLIAPDQKAWMDRMIKEGRIAIPPGGTLEKGSLYSMFIRMLLHNAMEEQKRQEAMDADDEDDE